MKAFVTGGTGFIGANLVEALVDKGIVALVLHRQSSPKLALEGLVYESVIGDVLESPEILAEKMAGCSWVFHVAAVSDYWRHGKKWIYEVNVEGTKNVLQAAKIASVKRFVYTSSIMALGIPADGQLITEADVFNLPPYRSHYGYSKHLAEAEVRQAALNDLESVIVIPNVVLGPRDINKIGGSILLEIERGFLRYTLPGGANYIAVQDVAAGHIAAAECGVSGERYILDGENLSHREATKVIFDVMGRNAPRLSIPRWVLPIFAGAVAVARIFLGNRVPTEPNQVLLSGKNMYVDAGKAKKEFGLPQTPFRESVEQTYQWYREQGWLK